MKTRLFQNRYIILGLLTLLNLLNYVDRQVPAGVLPLIGEDLGITDFQKGIIYFSFLIVYTLIAPFTGLFGDRVKRKKLICASGIVWSLATAAAYFAPGYKTLLATRTFVGVGEAIFGILAPTIIIDLFKHRLRGRMISIFYLSIPLGGALGYLIGGQLGEAYGSWRLPFLVVGLPGLLVSFLIFFIDEPERGKSDDGVDSSAALARGDMSFGDLFNLLKNPAYLFLIGGYTCATWVVGGLSWWMVDYYHGLESMQISLSAANRRFGAVTFLGGLIGIPLGGYLADQASKWTEQGPALVSGIFLLLGALPAYFALTYLTQPYCWLFAFGAILGTFINTGPVNTAIMEVVPVHRRAAAIAMSILCIHLFGDLLAPPMIGIISDYFSLTTGLLLSVPIMVFGGLLWIWGARYLPGALERALEQSRTE